MTKFKNLEPGDAFVLQYKGDVIEDGAYIPKFRKWRVIKVYSNHVLCRYGQIRECFTYGEMIQQGLERCYNPEIKKERARSTRWRQNQNRGE